MRKVKQCKGFVIASGNADSAYPFYVFTADEWSYGEGFRYPEFECDSVEECLENIVSV